MLWFSILMKAQPCKLIPGKGYVPCEAVVATHITLNIPGPTGELTLPVQQRGTREGTGNWTWNGDTEKPTLIPSVLSQGTNFLGGDPTDKANWPAYRCHTWITDGAAQFLDDCDHELRGQTVALFDVENTAVSDAARRSL
jgi:hypothetical protein